MSIEKRYIVAPSDIHYGKYIVIDTKRETIYRFHNLASARAFAKQKNDEENQTYCEVCGCDPCDCHWGDY